MRLKVYSEIPWAPIGPVKINSGSALPIEVVDVPSHALRVGVAITNATGYQYVLNAEKNGDVWRCIFPASCFTSSGYVANGVRVVVVIRENEDCPDDAVVYSGDFEVIASDVGCNPGTRVNVSIRGEDIYQKTSVVDGVQHYAKQVLSWDDEMGAWSADWVGDFVIVGGVFMEA